MKFEPHRALFPFENRFFTTSDGSALHYVDEGRGQPVVLLHGNPPWSFLYRRMIQVLAPHYRCVAPDCPGFGLSEASLGYDFRPDSHARVIDELFEHLKLSNTVVVMQDWGGPIGRSMATVVNGVWRFFMARGFARRAILFLPPSFPASWYRRGPSNKTSSADWAPCSTSKCCRCRGTRTSLSGRTTWPDSGSCFRPTLTAHWRPAISGPRIRESWPPGSSTTGSGDATLAELEGHWCSGALSARVVRVTPLTQCRGTPESAMTQALTYDAQRLELSRAALRPWPSANLEDLYEAAKRARLERIC